MLSSFLAVSAFVGAAPRRRDFVGIIDGGVVKIIAAVRAGRRVLALAGSHLCCSFRREIFREVLPDPGWGHHCNV